MQVTPLQTDATPTKRRKDDSVRRPRSRKNKDDFTDLCPYKKLANANEAQQKALANPQAVTEELDKLLTPRAKEKCQVFQSKGKAYMFAIKENVLTTLYIQHT